jgi:hypothetical protein
MTSSPALFFVAMGFGIATTALLSVVYWRHWPRPTNTGLPIPVMPSAPQCRHAVLACGPPQTLENWRKPRVWECVECGEEVP